MENKSPKSSEVSWGEEIGLLLCLVLVIAAVSLVVGNLVAKSVVASDNQKFNERKVLCTAQAWGTPNQPLDTDIHISSRAWLIKEGDKPTAENNQIQIKELEANLEETNAKVNKLQMLIGCMFDN